jgi:hypothetical protein
MNDVHEEDQSGRCRRNPPAYSDAGAILLARYMAMPRDESDDEPQEDSVWEMWERDRIDISNTVWPIVMIQIDWCGEFKPRESQGREA